MGKTLDIHIDRKYRKAEYTVSNLYLDGQWFCNVLERRDRGLRQDMGERVARKMKVPGDTAIPSGHYRVVLDVKSPSFSRKRRYAWCGGFLPRLVGVPGFSGILIHAGVTAMDSRGCLIVGMNTSKGRVSSSMITLKRLYRRMQAAEELWLTVDDPPSKKLPRKIGESTLTVYLFAEGRDGVRNGRRFCKERSRRDSC